MRNIIILGVPRSGKTTLARRVKKEFPEYIFIEEDLISTAASCIFHEVANTNASLQKYPNWRGEIAELSESISHQYLGLCLQDKEMPFIYVSCSLSIPIILKNVDLENTILIVMGYPNIPYKEKLKLIREYDPKSEWTSFNTTEFMKNAIKTYIQDSKKFKVSCKKYRFKFYDTSYHYERVLDEAFSDIKKQMGILS